MRRLGRAVGFVPEETVFTKQVHSAVVERVGRADCGRGLFSGRRSTASTAL